jgi:hypothetical protein
MTAVAMPLEFRFGEIGHDMVVELAGGLEVAGAAVRALHGTDIMVDEDGAGWWLRPEAAGVLAEFLVPAVDAGAVGLIAAANRPFAARTEVLELVLDLGQSAAQVGILGLQVGDPLLQRGDEGQDSGLGLGWDRVPEWCGDRRWTNHTLDYEGSVQKVRLWDGTGRPRTSISKRRTA